jgi:hypothetical protein
MFPGMRSRSRALAVVLAPMLAGLAGCTGGAEVFGRIDAATISPTATWLGDPNQYSESVDAADWNGDGILDLAFAGGNDDDPPAGSPNRVYQGRGDGTFELVWTSPESEHSLAVAWADVDGDGDPDLAVGNDSQPDRLYENVGGDLVSVWQSEVDDGSFGVAWADVDGDGDPDLSVANIDGPNVIYVNSDGELGTEPAWEAPHDEETSALAWADVDGDGDLDLACANEPDAANRLYRNDGGALVSVWTSDRAYTSVGVAWADMDGDGLPEVAFVDEWVGFTVYDNEAGTLGAQPLYEHLGVDSGDDVDNDDIEWGDFDQDGRPDLVIVGHQRDRVWRNDGAGGFTEWWRSPGSLDAATGVAVADFDGDGDPDLAVAMASGRDAVFTNLGPEPQEIVDNDGDGVPFPLDCDDDDPAIGPAPEICDGRDNNCDGTLLPEERDGDRDGFGPCQGDCDDDDPLIGPDSPECLDGPGDDDDSADRDGEDDGGCGCSHRPASSAPPWLCTLLALGLWLSLRARACAPVRSRPTSVDP